MKITAKKLSNDVPVTLDITIFTDHPIFHDDLVSKLKDKLVAATVPELPQGPVIERKKARVTGSMEDDFESFLERIVDFCEFSMHLIGTYNNSYHQSVVV